MTELITEMFSYHFMSRAIIVGVLVSLCAALLGVSLVLKRYSMIGDGLSHVGFGALAIAAAVNVAPLAIAVPVVVAAAFLLLRISQSSRIKGDAAIALISSSALAIGVVVISMTTGMNTDVSNYMFGSILAMSRSDVFLSVTLALCVLALYVLFYHKLFSVTFDESFARATGVHVGAYKTILSVLTALTVVLGMRMMGAMLLSSLIIFPALSAMRLFKSFRSVVCFAAALSHGARLLLLDEATSGLDPLVRDEILTILMEFTRDERHAVLLSSHIVSDLEKACDYIALLHGGTLLLCDEKDRLLERFGVVRGSAGMLRGIDRTAIRGRRDTNYGTELLVERALLPAGQDAAPVSIEDLFLYLAREAG